MRMHKGMAAAVIICAVACGKADPETRSNSEKQGHVVPTSNVPTSNVTASNVTASNVTASEKRGGIEIPAGLPPAQQLAAEKARDALLAACSAQPFDWKEFKEVSLKVGKASGYVRDQYDWDLMVTVAMVYNEGADRRRGGHRIEFDMGAGTRPGIVTRKSQALELCGFAEKARSAVADKPCDPQAGEDCILDVPSLEALDDDRPPAVVVSQRTAPVAWCFGHGFDPPPFWQCATTEKQCKKARAVEKRDENDDYKVRTECTKTESLHCFTTEIGRTVCAPDGPSCAVSRKQWTSNATATVCEVATANQLTASNRKDPD